MLLDGEVVVGLVEEEPGAGDDDAENDALEDREVCVLVELEAVAATEMSELKAERRGDWLAEVQGLGDTEECAIGGRERDGWRDGSPILIGVEEARGALS